MKRADIVAGRTYSGKTAASGQYNPGRGWVRTVIEVKDGTVWYAYGGPPNKARNYDNTAVTSLATFARQAIKETN